MYGTHSNSSPLSTENFEEQSIADGMRNPEYLFLLQKYVIIYIYIYFMFMIDHNQ